MRRAVFLDRDGTIIEDTGYISGVARVRFLPGAAEAIKLLNRRNYLVIIITNQAGVARGYFTEETLAEINAYVEKSLSAAGALIDMIYYCPHHVDGVVEEYRKDCYWRKPNPGMIEEAARDFGIDLKASFVIGDKPSDIEAGRRAGCRNILLAGPNDAGTDAGGGAAPDYVAPDLFQAVKWLLLENADEKKR